MRTTIDFNMREGQESICNSCLNLCKLESHEEYFCGRSDVKFREIPLDKVYDCSEYINKDEGTTLNVGSCSWVDQVVSNLPQEELEDLGYLEEVDTNLYNLDTKELKHFQEQIQQLNEEALELQREQERLKEANENIGHIIEALDFYDEKDETNNGDKLYTNYVLDEDVKHDEVTKSDLHKAIETVEDTIDSVDWNML